MWKRCITAIFVLLLVVAAAFAGSTAIESLKPARSYEPADEGDGYVPEELSATEKAQSTPTKEEVLAAREKALEGMTPEQIERLNTVVSSTNLRWERAYLHDNIFGKLEDPDSLTWNYFDQTGEIQIGWAMPGELDMEAVCWEEGLSEDDFYAKYCSKVKDTNDSDADAFALVLDELCMSAQNQALKTDLQYIRDELQLAKRTHVMEHANNLYKALHDMDYFLLRYGPAIDEGKDEQWIKDKSTVSKYYGMLSIYD